MSALKNDNFLRALARQPVTRQPIWLMRQAGRYLPEYRALRKQAGNFLTLCKTPELACAVTLQPIERFDLDAAILFSDILTIPDAMGMGLQFVENEGPCFSMPLHTARDIQKLPIPDPTVELRYVCDAVTLIQRTLAQRVPLIGFAGSPWTVACYMLEGGRSAKQFERVRTMVYQQPKILHLLLEKLTETTLAYLKAQIESGVDVVMLFDTWGGLLSAESYELFSLHYMQRIISGLPQNIPTIFFTKNGGLWLDKIARSGCSAVGIDWTMDLSQAVKMTENRVALQGNLDPLVLLASEPWLYREIHAILQKMHMHPGFIFNLGHGILPTTSPERVKFLVDTVHSATHLCYS